MNYCEEDRLYAIKLMAEVYLREIKMSLLLVWKSSSSSSFEGYPLQVRHKQDCGREFILLLPQTAVLPESDAGSGAIKPASSLSFKTVRSCAPCGA